MKHFKTKVLNKKQEYFGTCMIPGTGVLRILSGIYGRIF